MDDAGEVTGSAVRSYVTVERPSGGKQIRKAKQHTPGKPVGSPIQAFKGEQCCEQLIVTPGHGALLNIN